MKDRHVKEQLSAYLDGMLTPDEAKHVEAHVRECADCNGVLTELKGMLSWMKAVPHPSPRAGLETRMIARLDAAPQKKRFAPFWVTVSGGLATAMAALLIFVMVRENHLEKPAALEMLRANEAADTAYDFKAPAPMSGVSAAKISLDKAKPAAAPPAEQKKVVAKDADVASLEKMESMGGASRGAALADRMEMPTAKSEFMVRRADAPKKFASWIIRSKKEFDDLGGNTAMPDVDFSKQMIIAVPGHQDIVSEEFINTAQGRTLVIHIKRILPTPAPYHFKVLPSFLGPIQFHNDN